MSEEELHFLQHHLVALIHIKGFADSFDQLCFQMERLWHSLFGRSYSEAEWWFGECETTLGGAAFMEARRDLAEALQAGKVKGSKVEELLALSDSVLACYKVLSGKDKTHREKDYYRYTLDGERHAVALSRLILAIFSDLQRQILGG